MTTAATLSSVTSDVSPRTAAVRVVRLAKKYGDTQAVGGIDLDIRRGEIFGLIGPDGAGKTTTFQILAGVMEATSGVAEIFGRPARQMRSQTGYLTQAFSLYPELTVKENIRYVGDLRSVPPRDIASRATRYLEMFDMLRFQDRLAGRLSGGMKQKLALGLCAGTRSRACCCSTSRPPASTRSLAGSSGMCSLISRAMVSPSWSRHRIWTKPNAAIAWR